MKALSFSQPWLWAILYRGKRVENRPWMPTIQQIGMTFVLHAAKSFDKKAYGMFHELGIMDAPSRRDLFPAGALVGLATIDRVVTDDRSLDTLQRGWFFGPVGIILSDVRVFQTPIPAKGMLGLWDIPAELEPDVVRATASATAAQMTVRA